MDEKQRDSPITEPYQMLGAMFDRLFPLLGLNAIKEETTLYPIYETAEQCDWSRSVIDFPDGIPIADGWKADVIRSSRGPFYFGAAWTDEDADTLFTGHFDTADEAGQALCILVANKIESDGRTAAFDVQFNEE